MIGKKHRFHGHNSVSRVRGRRVSTPFFTVFYADAPKRRNYRMAVVVSKKISKSAVTRNRIRRRLYEAVRVDDQLNGVAVDVVFVVRNAELATMPAELLALQISQTTSKITSKP